jgi:hypothetical protein
LSGECGLPAEHDYDDDYVDGGAQDEDWHPPHKLDQVPETVPKQKNYVILECLEGFSLTFRATK